MSSKSSSQASRCAVNLCRIKQGQVLSTSTSRRAGTGPAQERQELTEPVQQADMIVTDAAIMQVSGTGADGITKLLAAETEAQRIVSEARKAKQDRLRQAKAEAEGEIKAYRAEREGAYQKKLSEGSSGAAATLQRLSSETGVTIQQIQSNVKAKKGQIVDLLTNYVSSVRFN